MEKIHLGISLQVALEPEKSLIVSHSCPPRENCIFAYLVGRWALYLGAVT
jgi:hypothetical protein